MNQEYADKLGAILTSMDDKFTPTSDGWAGAMILLASYEMGANEPFIAEELGYDPEFVALVGSRLRNSKIWLGELLSDKAIARYEQEEGGIAFFLDTNVANGSMKIGSYRKEDGEPLYSMTDSGKRHVENMLGIGKK